MRTSWGVAFVFCSLPAASWAGGTIKLGENQSITVGGGLRNSLNFVEDGSPSGTSFGKQFTFNSARLYLSGQIAKGLNAEFNTELNSLDDDSVRVLDAVMKIEYSEAFRIWAGRFLPPSDRANLDGPYYMPLWNYPFVSAFPAIFAGRDDGLAVWGQFKGGGFKYQLGAFQGTKGGPNQDDNPRVAGRLVLNLRDPEPGYYNSSTYWGAKKIFAIGVTAQAQADAGGTAASPEDFSGFEVDALFEQPTNAGTFTAEGAFYTFDWGAASPASGDAYYGWIGYLLKSKTGPGQFQPVVRFQSFNSDVSGRDVTQIDGGLNYVIAGDNARFHATFSKLGGDADGTSISFGAQLQF